MVNAGNGIITGWPKHGMMRHHLEAEMQLTMNVRPTFWGLASKYYYILFFCDLDRSSRAAQFRCR